MNSNVGIATVSYCFPRHSALDWSPLPYTTPCARQFSRSFWCQPFSCCRAFVLFPYWYFNLNNYLSFQFLLAARWCGIRLGLVMPTLFLLYEHHAMWWVLIKFSMGSIHSATWSDQFTVDIALITWLRQPSQLNISVQCEPPDIAVLFYIDYEPTCDIFPIRL